MSQNRFRSPVLWSALAAQLLSMLVVLGVTAEELAGAAQE